MTKLENALKTCMKQCDALKIPYGKVLSIEPAKGTARRWGVCHYKPGIGSTIEINKLLLGGDVKEIYLLDTVMHELLHTCPECQNHGAVWKRYAAMVNKAYGYNVKRGTSAEEKEIPIVRPVARYKYKCLGCGAIIERQRASNFIKHPESYRCGNCKGKFIAL